MKDKIQQILDKICPIPTTTELEKMALCLRDENDLRYEIKDRREYLKKILEQVNILLQ